jgi:hypothetical protein
MAGCEGAQGACGVAMIEMVRSKRAAFDIGIVTKPASNRHADERKSFRQCRQHCLAKSGETERPAITMAKCGARRCEEPFLA